MKFPLLIRHAGHTGKLFFNKTNVAAAFDATDPNLRQVVGMCTKMHVPRPDHVRRRGSAAW